jgi:hypothetical protein
MTSFNNSCLAKDLGKSYPKEGSKHYKMLEHFRSGNSLNSIEAARLGDHCLSTTIHDLSNQYYLEIPRKSEVVINSFGSRSKLTRYWLSDSDLQTLNLIKQ